MRLTALSNSDIWDCFYIAKNKSLISIGCRSFNSNKEDDCERLGVRWRLKMVTNIAANTISSAFCDICRVVHSSSLRLQQYRTLCSLYHTPERIAKWSSNGFTSDWTK